MDRYLLSGGSTTATHIRDTCTDMNEPHLGIRGLKWETRVFSLDCQSS